MTYAKRLAAQKKAIEEAGKLKVESRDESSIKQFLDAMKRNKGSFSIHMHVASTDRPDFSAAMKGEAP